MTQCTCSFCSKCGQLTITHTCPSTPANVNSSTDKATILKYKISQIEQLTERLQVELAAWRMQLNQEQSAIAELPSEIHSTIFQLACSSSLTSSTADGIRHRYPILVLSSVSACWRQVALEMPGLWRHLRVRLLEDGKPPSLANLKSLMRLSYQRSNLQPLNLEVRTGGYHVVSRYSPEYNLTKADDAVFVNYPKKIQTLTLEVLGYYWTPYVSKVGPQLNKLRLRWEKPLEDYLYQKPDFKKIPWLTHITILEIGGLTSADAFELLWRCISLVEFRYYDPNSQGKLHHEPAAPVTLRSLKRLELDGVDVENRALRDLQKKMRVPSLERFSWIISRSTSISTYSISNLCRKLQDILGLASASLQEVEICFPFLRLPETQELLTIVAKLEPNVHTLSLAVDKEGSAMLVNLRIHCNFSKLTQCDQRPYASEP
ncbi:hypothetical protein NP233_g12739 [Leucocoprinus birnbaumii]|uniref:F-box domain-containing protein n=1 Tax=Leucocoprinus birnbaumii TaxID=56174 RepID=A0AAD5VDV7_9AGAR|nr:hypothetical protein NP233_g12739 [Leucocoprinus birnbaumii]